MEFEKLAQVYKALGDPTRLKIVALLLLRDCCVCELVPLFGISQPAVSKHMSRLKAAELVRETRKGQWVFYSLNRQTLDKIGFCTSNLPDVTRRIKELEEKGIAIPCE